MKDIIIHADGTMPQILYELRKIAVPKGYAWLYRTREYAELHMLCKECSAENGICRGASLATAQFARFFFIK